NRVEHDGTYNFFFSSRRRHTRFSRDWSSDVCSSDLVPKAKGSAHPNIAPYQAFRASDGWFVMAAATDKQYRSACDVVGRPELKDDSRFVTNADRVVNRAELVDELNQVFGTQPVTHWVEVLNAAGIPTGPVRTIDEVFES